MMQSLLFTIAIIMELRPPSTTEVYTTFQDLHVAVNRGNQTRYVTVVTKHLFFVMHRPRSDGTRNYNRYMTKL